MLESNGSDVEVVSVSLCYCVMLGSLAFLIPVIVVSSCESEFVSHSREPQRFISHSILAGKTAREVLAVTTTFPSCLAKESRCLRFFGRTVCDTLVGH